MLPGPDFVWSDGHLGPIRTVAGVGTWEAIEMKCSGTSRSIFELTAASCNCLDEIANAFSPNQDGINDELILESPCDVQVQTLSVFDRWGELVFSANGLPAIWDGTHRGKEAPEGVYYLVIKAHTLSPTGEIERINAAQTITLLR